MSNAITMGIFWHLIGAASAACFYAPFKKVKKWSWETMWSVGGIVSWIILPWAISALLLPNFWAYYSSFSLSTLLPVFLFGWAFLTQGLHPQKAPRAEYAERRRTSHSVQA